MNNFRKILFFILTIGFTASVFFSCEDDFTEEDLLNLQNQLALDNDSLKAAQDAAAINMAGQMMSYLVKVVTDENTPVQGATVTLAAATSDSTATANTQSVTTDASGNAFFERVVIGANLMTISATNFFDALVEVDFGRIEEGEHYEIINNNVVPLPKSVSSILPLFTDQGGANLATLTGNVSIETDLTNDTTEVAAGVEIVADLGSFAAQFIGEPSSDVTISQYSFQSGDRRNLGRATTDANGNYTLQIPSTEGGVSATIRVPTISRSQRLAVKGIDGIDLARPEYVNATTTYGPFIGSTAIPDVPGIIVQASAPTAAGIWLRHDFR